MRKRATEGIKTLPQPPKHPGKNWNKSSEVYECTTWKRDQEDKKVQMLQTWDEGSVGNKMVSEVYRITDTKDGLPVSGT